MPRGTQSVYIYISGRGKDDHLTGEVSVPKETDPKCRIWKAENRIWKAENLPQRSPVMVVKFHDHRNWRKFPTLQNSQRDMGCSKGNLL
ncbi:hypothetical protein LIER_07369 [Lithospermum erythrorhizon]|uniref:Uncharacterized protein n=1 Tax=Lithospermum erythrorhizon TaxID=34254 RepID=A0AAV3P8Y4_LITER